MTRISLALPALLLLAAGCEAAGTPDAPGAAAMPERQAPAIAPGYEPPAPGTIIVVRHRDGALETSRVLGSEGHVVTMLREDERSTEIPFCFRCGPPLADLIEPGRYRALWPLEPGRSVTFERRAGDGTIRIHDVGVTGTETVETDFGPVETLVIEETVTQAGGGWEATRRQWFSPLLGWTVRSEWDAPDDSGGWELAAIALPR